MKFFVLAALAVATAMPAQTPVRDLRNPAQPPAGTGVIRGMVVADATGSAVRLAHVVVIGALTGTLRVTMTDPEGRFAVSGLPADRYTVAASKPPYLGAIAGGKRRETTDRKDHVEHRHAFLVREALRLRDLPHDLDLAEGAQRLADDDVDLR